MELIGEAGMFFSSMPLDLRCLSWVSDLSPFLHSDHSAGTGTLCGGGRTGGLGVQHGSCRAHTAAASYSGVET